MPLIYARNGSYNVNRTRQYNYQGLLNGEEEDEYVYSTPANDSDSESSSSSSDSSSNSDEEEEDSSSSSSSDDGIVNIIQVNIDSNSEEEEGTITESFTRSRVDIYRLAIRTNSEILEDLAAIIRILRQINALYRVFNNSSNSFTSGLLRSYRQRNQTRPHRIHSDSDSDDDDDEEEEITEEEEEANKLLEAGLEDLQAVLTSETNHLSTSTSRSQSTLALLSLITYQYNHCSEEYLQRYLDPNGEYNPTLAILAAAAYDDDDDNHEKSCRDIILAAEEIYGPDWLKEFHRGKEGALRKMLEKLTFVAKIRLKVRDSSTPVAR